MSVPKLWIFSNGNDYAHSECSIPLASEGDLVVLDDRSREAEVLDLVPADRVFFTKLPLRSHVEIRKLARWVRVKTDRITIVPCCCCLGTSDFQDFVRIWESCKPPDLHASFQRSAASRLSRRDRIVRWISSTMISLLIGDAFQLI